MGSQWMWVAAVVVGVAQAATATDRFYPNQTAKSDNGKFRIDAVSPDNPKDGGWGRAFASNFTYTLTEVDTGRVVWTRKQEMERSKGEARPWWREGSPMRVFVSDAGTVAAYVAGEALIVLDSKTGKKVAEHDLLELFSEAERSTYVANSTAGPIWTQFSWFGFVSERREDGVKTRELFEVRPFWACRLMFDTATGRRVELGAIGDAKCVDGLEKGSAEARACVRAALRAERAHVAKMLAKAETIADENAWDLSSAVVMAGQLGFKECVPALRVVEQKTAIGPEQHWSYLRRHIRTALRRLGETPAPGYGVKFQLRNGPVEASIKTAEERRAGAERVRAGMSAIEMIGIMGHPDFDDRWWDSPKLEFDIDGPDAFTLRVHLSLDRGEVVRTEQLRPPTYEQGYQREAGW